MSKLVRTKSLSDAVRDDKQRAKDTKADGYDKRVTLLKAASASKDAGTTGAFEAGGLTPTDDQLARINEFTRSPKTAEQVVAFQTWSCNDLEDRDMDAFTAQTVKDFAALEPPFSFTGKSYMVGHDYSKLPVGRIFGTATENKDGVTWLTNEVYIPNTDTNKSLIENIDFGVNWAVSVGVMLDANRCSLDYCKQPMSRWGGWCYGGHDKGSFYVENGETDDWGYPLPVPEDTSGAEKCIGIMEGARDAYELSQVFLGAQFYAELKKNADFKGVIKAASAKVPIIGLSAKEAAGLPIPHLDPRVVDAQKRFGAKIVDDGIIKWTDDQRLVWTYDPEDSEVRCLGKAADDADEEGEDDGTAEGESESGAQGADDEEQSDDELSASADDGEGDDSADGGSGSGTDGEGEGSVGDVTSADSNNDDEEGTDKAVSKTAVLSSLRAIGADETLVQAVDQAKGSDLGSALSALVAAHAKAVSANKALESKAALGEQYIATKRSEAVDWYVKAHQDTSQNKGVNTDTFVKMLDMFGDNIEMIEQHIEMQKELAQSKFPGQVRRSSFPMDPNNVTPPAQADAVVGESKTVSRLHD